MKHIRPILFIIVASFLSSCMAIDSRNEMEGGRMIIHASMERVAETRTMLVDGGVQVYWDPADEIKVFFKGAAGRFVSQNTEPVPVTDFSGTINLIAGANESTNSNNLIWGLYPYRADAMSDGVTVITTLPDEQTGKAGSFAKDTHITLAQSIGLDLSFYNVCGGMRFSLTQEGIKRVTFEGNDGGIIAGKVRLAFENGIPVVEEILEGKSRITLTAPNGGTFQTGEWYYISAIPSPLHSGFKMVFYRESDSATLTSSDSRDFKRGVFGSLTEVDKGLVFEETGGDDEPDPDPSSFIQFVDPIAKFACVERFDTNHDGELSYEEAAAVTSLKGLFENWMNVTRFDEIKYFKNVTSTVEVFHDLTKLESIVIPDNITTLGRFQNCYALTSVVLPDHITSLPNQCFLRCRSLQSVDLPSALKEVQSGCFSQSAITNISLPEGISSIPVGCFTACTSLVSVDLPASIKSVEAGAFMRCSSLSAVDLPPGVETIGAEAFEDCTSFTSFSFPPALKSIERGAFKGCTGIPSISLGNDISIGESAFQECTGLTSVLLGSGVGIGDYAFSGCTGIISMVLQSGVTLGKYSFSGCSSLKTIVLPPEITVIPSYCFQNCRKLSSVVWPDALQGVGSYAFSGCDFKDNNYTIELPETVTSIGSEAFGQLRHLIIPHPSVVSILKDSFFQHFTYLYVPAHLVELYKLRSPWSNYSDTIFPLSDYPRDPFESITVDLGLSVKWASVNVGATRPEVAGSRFAWGETEPKDEYDWPTYAWGNGASNSLIKYNTNSEYGAVDDRTELGKEDDVAREVWGGSWRMPTKAEIQELYDNCSVVATFQNQAYIYCFRSKVEGYTDKFIYLPDQYYWTSSLDSDNPSFAYGWMIRLADPLVTRERCQGLVVRPVME